ncbi:MAG TPA: PAS domain S-box protein [Bacteroidales bacterium]|nr:PAS domain S-box protein [Bacteroidales bacterium]
MNQKQHKILIIDDMASNRLALSGLITSHFEKAEITMAENGEEGLRLIENIKPDLVLLDIIMPGMDGFEVCTRLKQLDETKEIPVLLLSAVKTDSNARIKALECGAEAFLSRPVEDAELMAQIYALLREKIEEDQKEQSMLQLELLVKERTQLLEKELSERKATEIQLQQAIKSFEDQRKASINLLQDLHDEMAEKRKTQETLSSSEERFRLVFENSPLGMLTFAPDGVITACNERFVSIIGSSYEQLLGLQMLQLPDEKMVSALQQTLNGENAYYEGLYVSMTANKSTWVKVHFSPIFDKNAVITGGVGLVEDVTEQVQSEKLRQEYEDRFKKSFYSSPVAISITRLPDSMYIDINDAYCRLTGFSREQIVGHTVFELGVIDLELRQRILDEIIQGNDIHEFLVPVHTRSHDIKLVYISVEPYEMNEVKYLFTTLIDVTEQKMYEKELVKLTRAVEQSPVSIVITDLEGVIEYVNP